MLLKFKPLIIPIGLICCFAIGAMAHSYSDLKARSAQKDFKHDILPLIITYAGQAAIVLEEERTPKSLLSTVKQLKNVEKFISKNDKGIGSSEYPNLESVNQLLRVLNTINLDGLVDAHKVATNGLESENHTQTSQDSVEVAIKQFEKLKIQRLLVDAQRDVSIENLKMSSTSKIFYDRHPVLSFIDEISYKMIEL